MYKAIIFDVDGTILDTESTILKSFQKTLQEHTGVKYEISELTFCLGIPGKEALKRLNIENIDDVHKHWCNNVLLFSNEVNVFEGLKDVLAKIAISKLTGVVTSKTNKEMRNEYDSFALKTHLPIEVCADDTEHHKPHPQPLHTFLEKANIQPSDAIYIGDSVYDMQCAKAAGVHFGLALWGAKSADKFKKAEYVFEKPEDLLRLLEKQS